MSDKSDGLLAPRNTFAPITPSDSTTLALKGIVFKTAGVLVIADGNGTQRTIPSGVLAVGIIHNIAITKVYATNTTATDIWGVS